MSLLFVSEFRTEHPQSNITFESLKVPLFSAIEIVPRSRKDVDVCEDSVSSF